MITNQYVADYIGRYQGGKVQFNRERVQLLQYLDRFVLSDDSLYFNDAQIDACIHFTEKWFFKLQPFQKFLIAFVFLYHRDGTNYYQNFLWLMGRGSGKNGLISALDYESITKLNYSAE